MQFTFMFIKRSFVLAQRPFAIFGRISGPGYCEAFTIAALLLLAGCSSGGTATSASGSATGSSTVATSSTSPASASEGGISLLNHPITGPNQLLSADVLSSSPAASSVVQASIISGGTLVGVSAGGQTLVNLPLANVLGGTSSGVPNSALAGEPLTEVAGVVAQASNALSGQAGGISLLPSLTGDGVPGAAAALLTPLLNVPLTLASTAGDQSTPLLGKPLSALDSINTGGTVTNTPVLGNLLTPVTGLVGDTLNGLTKTLDGVLQK